MNLQDWLVGYSRVGAVALGTFLVRVGLAPLSVEQMKAAERMAVRQKTEEAFLFLSFLFE